MRDAFAAQLHQEMAEDPRIMLLTADIGFKVFDRIVSDFPGRFINMGVAEANMLGVAAGLAMSGKRPVVYTIIPFLTMRAFEQIRVDVCIQKQPVTIVGVGGGVAYGTLGPTHHSIEDVAILRSLPNMTVVVPCDPQESRKATRAAFRNVGPLYIRLGKNGEPPLYGDNHSFVIGRAVELRSGADATIVVTGPISRVALEAADRLAGMGVRTRVLNVHTIKPIDAEAILRAARETTAVVSVEEHSIVGGLGSAVAEVLAEGGAAAPFRRLGVRDVYSYGVGSQEYHLRRHGLTVEAISGVIMGMLREQESRR
ncbi:MAG: transketolase [Actinobacteria bacterium]|nr:transketolase [Actinomycetota bacterium]